MTTQSRIAVAVGVLGLTAMIAPLLIVRPNTPIQTTDASNSIQAQPGTPAALAEILSRSCGDCHSDTMSPRWYTRVPPFAAIMARAVNEGRKAVNFSAWTRYSAEQQRALLLASCNDARRGTMPVGVYVRVRSDARLSERDVETICSASRLTAPTATTAGKAP